MCGIFGALTRTDAGHDAPFWEGSLRVLAKESQSRGKDSSGLVVHDHRDSTYRVFKGAIPLNSLLASRELSSFLREFDPSGTAVAIGHSRLVTNGSQLTADNNQPVIKNMMEKYIGKHW